MPGQPGETLVPLRVVLHRATAERIEVRVDRHVERRQVDEVTDDVGLRQLGQGRRRFELSWARRDQLVERLRGDVARRKECIRAGPACASSNSG